MASVTCALFMLFLYAKGIKCLPDAGTEFSLPLFSNQFCGYHGIAGILSLPGGSSFSPDAVFHNINILKPLYF